MLGARAFLDRARPGARRRADRTHLRRDAGAGARRARALTLVAGERDGIPNYHQPTDTVENLDPEVLEGALAVGRELVALVDSGGGDRA